jgi:phosphomannomutase/phosphoglucomutase
MAKKPAANPFAPQRDQNTLIRLVLRGALLGLLAVSACYVFLLIYDLPTHNAQQRERALRELAATQAALVDGWVAQYRQRLKGVATDLPLLAGSGDPANLARLAFPEAQSLTLVPLGPLGIASLDIAGAGLRNNIEADMVRRVSGGAATDPEIYRIDNQPLIAFAQPLAAAAGQATSGALLLRLPVAPLAELLKRQLGSRGQVELIQKGGQGAALTVGGGNTAGALTVDLTVAGWQLRVAPSAAWSAEVEQSPLPLYLALALSLVGILLGALVTAREFRVALERNMVGLANGTATDLPGFAALRERLAQRRPAPVAEPPPVAAPVAAPEPVVAVEEVSEPAVELPSTIFRAYDIRGVAQHQLTPEIVRRIGLAIGSEAVDRGQQTVVVARDGRDSSPAIADALIQGLRDSGRDVVDIGLAPTPLLYFATHQLGTQTGVMVTGSHNPPQYNGLKIVIAGRTLSGRAIQGLKERIERRQFSSGKGSYRSAEIAETYVDYIVNDVAIAQPLKVVIDAGNGVTGMVAPRLFEALGCEVIPLYCEVDGRFPNHHPDPTVAANLRDLVRAVQENGADLGIAFDGDGDRVGIVSGSGAIVAADRLLMLLAQDVVARNPGADVLFDVKCTRALNSVVAAFGGRPIMWKSGHSFMKEKMQETGALLGGEYSGHIFFNERWFGFDDGMYAAARLVEILSTTDPDLDNHLAGLPGGVATPEIQIEVGEAEKFALVTRIASECRFDDGKVTTLDGIRVDFADGWGLVRASNTGPVLTLRFEGDDDSALARVQQLFREQLGAIDPRLASGF